MKKVLFLIVIAILLSSVVAAVPQHQGNGRDAFWSLGFKSLATMKATVRNCDDLWLRYRNGLHFKGTREQFLCLSWGEKVVSGTFRVMCRKADGTRYWRKQHLVHELVFTVDCRPVILADCGNLMVDKLGCPLPPCVAAISPPCEEEFKVVVKAPAQQCMPVCEAALPGAAVLLPPGKKILRDSQTGVIGAWWSEGGGGKSCPPKTCPPLEPGDPRIPTPPPPNSNWW